MIEAQIEYYNKRWADEGYINRLELERAIAILRMVSRIKHATHIKPRILDFGCGRGWLSVILSQVGPTSGIDLSEKAIELAKLTHTNIEFISGDIFDTPLPHGTYDIVVSQEVIEHVENQTAFVEIVANVLKDNGFFIFTTPNAWVQNGRTSEEHKAWGLQPIENWIDKRQIRTLLRGKFTIIQIESIIPGYGTLGICRLVNSYKLNQILEKLKLKSPFQRMLLRMNFGLHLVILASKISPA